VLADDETTLALVSLDVLGVDWDVLADVRNGVAERTGIAPHALMINASHTHAGPATQTLRGLGDRDPHYVAEFVASVVETVAHAAQARQAARVGYGRVPVQVGINRRQGLDGGRTVLGENPGGPIVPYADILRVDAPDGEPIAVWFSHACHPTTLGGDNLAVSAEFPGVAVRVVEQVMGGSALFAQGCCGDINPRRRGSFHAVRTNGRLLGGAVVMGAEQIAADDPSPTLGAAMDTLQLSVQAPIPSDRADEFISSFAAQVEDAQAKGLHRGHVRLRQAWLDWARDMKALSERPDESPGSLPFEVQVLRVGDLSIVGLPGEVFAEYAINADAHSPFAQTAVLGYTNGCHGYVPTAAEYPRGGYEVNDAIRYYGTLMFVPASDGQLRAGVSSLLRRVKG
jgi:hypothetical protein